MATKFYRCRVCGMYQATRFTWCACCGNRGSSEVVTLTSPEDAQTIVEAVWKLRSEWGGTLGVCGWCEWANGNCAACPVPKVFDLEIPLQGDACYRLREFADWACVGYEAKKVLAAPVYRLAVEHRDDLIAAAKELAGESGSIEA